MKYILIITLSLFLSACASYGNKIDAQYATSIQEGVTTEHEVRKNLGNPFTTGVTPDGLKFYIYTYTQAQTKASTFIPVVGAFAGGADTQTQTLQIWFDKEGKVTSYSYNNSTQEIKTGLTAL